MPNLLRIAPELPVPDLRGALDNYQRKLGFRVTVEMPDQSYAIVERDDIAIHLFLDSTGAHTPLGIHIFTQDLDAMFSEFQRSGARVSQDIVRKPWGNRDFRVKDDFGNELKFTEPLEED
jgi:uncharacterized glyoxalase superfamily protein PhnB